MDAPGAADPFYAAVARTAADYHLSAFVTLTRSPPEVAGVYPGFEVLDARPGTPLDDPDGLLAAIRERCRPFERDLILFDSLEAMAERQRRTPAARTHRVDTCRHPAPARWRATWLRSEVALNERHPQQSPLCRELVLG